MKAIISHNPQARIWGEPEIVDTVEITHCLALIKELSNLAEVVNNNPSQFCEIAQMMAMVIEEIRIGVTPPAEVSPE